jgi:hypothetical protein
MPFPKGSNGGSKGRIKGKPNHLTTKARELFTAIMEAEVPRIKEAFDKVYSKDPAKYLELQSKFFPYFVPKKVDITTDGESINNSFVLELTPLE